MGWVKRSMILSRTDFKKEGVFGVLSDRDNQTVCRTLEHAYLCADDGFFRPKIPQGNYLCVRGMHHLAGGTDLETFEVLGVYGHKGLIFHPGNSNADSAGCILLGEAVKNDRLVNSRVTFLDFMQLLRGVESFTLTVV